MNTPRASTMDCATVQKKLSAFADAEVSPAWRETIEAHIATCPDCRQVLAQLRQLWLDLEDSMPVHPRPEFAREVMRRISEPSPSGAFDWRRALASLFPVSAAMAALVLFGLVLGASMGQTLLEETMRPMTTAATSQGQAATLDALDVFAPTPRGSLAQGYFVLVSDAARR